MSGTVLPVLSPGSFSVSGLAFGSLIHFEFIFVCGVGRSSILLHGATQFSQHHLLKKLSFLHCKKKKIKKINPMPKYSLVKPLNFKWEKKFHWSMKKFHFFIGAKVQITHKGEKSS